MPSWHSYINQSPHPDLASVIRPHGSPPQISCVVLLVTGLRISHYSNLPLASSLSQSLYSPQVLPPTTIGSNPSSLPTTTLCPRLPPPPCPPSSRPGPSRPFQWHSLSPTPSISFLRPPPTLVLSFTVSPVPHLSVIRPPDQCRPRTHYPYRILHSPCPQLTPLYLTHTTPPTLTHWWFSTWGAQPRHPTDGSPPLMHQPINLHLPTP